MIKFGRFEFLETLYYSVEHMWVKLESKERVRVGIDSLNSKGEYELYHIDFMIKTDSVIERGEPIGTIETYKSVIDLVAPVSGKVLELNERVLTLGPSIIIDDSYGEGWLLVLEPSNKLQEELDILLYGKKAVEWFRKEVSEKFGGFEEEETDE